MAKIVDMHAKVDPIDEGLSDDVLRFVNRRSDEISNNFYADSSGRLRTEETGSFLGIGSLRYLLKRAFLEGIKWKENEIK